MLTLEQALERILTNDSDGVKPPECELMEMVEGIPAGTTLSVESLLGRVRGVTAGESTQSIFTVARSMQNWQVMRGSTELIRSHPWSTAPNVAYLASGNRPGHVTAQVHSIVGEVEKLAERTMRADLLAESLVLRRMALSLRMRFGLPCEEARDAAARLERLVSEFVRSRQNRT